MPLFEPDQTLAQIVEITAIEPIKTADNIEIARVLGWQVVVKKDTHHVGELVIYFGLNAVLPKDNPNTAFLNGDRIKTRLIRGVYSQGVIGPLTWLESFNITEPVNKGDDLTAKLPIKKWIPEDEQYQYTPPLGATGGTASFPSFINKTNEERIQNVKMQLQDLESRQVVITKKYDGCSATFYCVHGKFGMCSRNLILQTPDNNNSHYFEMEKLYDLQNKLQNHNANIAIQGEIIGPKINGNRHFMYYNNFYVFNIFDIDKSQYLSFDEVTAICTQFGLTSVPVIYQGPFKNEWTNVDALIALANEQMYDNGIKQVPAEGLVVKTNDSGKRISFKVISNKYLCKYNL